MPFLSYNLTTHTSAIFCQKDVALELAKVKRERDLYKEDCKDKERRIQEYYGILAQNETQLEVKTEELLVSFLFIIRVLSLLQSTALHHKFLHCIND